MKAANHHWHVGRPELTRQVQRSRKLVRLNTHQPDKTVVRRLDAGNDLFDVQDRVGFVMGDQVN